MTRKLTIAQKKTPPAFLLSPFSPQPHVSTRPAPFGNPVSNNSLLTSPCLTITKPTSETFYNLPNPPMLRQSDVRHFFGAISWRVRPSLPWCFGVASVAEYWQKTIFNRVSEGTLNSFLVRFRGVSVLHCHGVLVWRRAVFSTGRSTTGKGWQNWQKTIFNIGTGGSTTGKGSQNWQKAIFNRISEGTLDTFLVRFRGVSVLHCHGVLVWRSIGKRLFLIGFQKGR